MSLSFLLAFPKKSLWMFQVEANAKRDAERRSLSKKPGPLRGSEETAPPSGRHRLSAPLGVGEQLPKEMEKLGFS